MQKLQQHAFQIIFISTLPTMLKMSSTKCATMVCGPCVQYKQYTQYTVHGNVYSNMSAISL